MDDRLTPEERAVFEATMAVAQRKPAPWDIWRQLDDAIAAYRKATAPPEPFEAYIVDQTIATFGNPPKGRQAVIFEEPPHNTNGVYRCTVTPTERVQ